MQDYNDGYATSSPVGAFPANAHGLYDMGGNVWQWCEDWWDAEHKVRVLRGASWHSFSLGDLRSTNRTKYTPAFRGPLHGFRCVLELAPSTAAASPTPHLPVSKPADPKFPPGQWVKLFTKPEDLPADLRKPDSGVTWEDGWIRISSTERKRFDLPRELGKNMAVRLRAKRIAEATAITLRYDAKTDSRYTMMPGSDARLLVERVQSTQRSPIIAEKNAPLKRGDEYTLEFGVVGKRLVGRFPEPFVRTAEDPTFPDGTAYISGSEDLHDIEVINLDGLPEAEALRLLGVDEQGKDLRGKTGAGK